MSEAFELVGPRQFRRHRQTLGVIAPDDIRVRFLFCGICGSDLSTFEGRRSIQYPRSLGHEFLAEVVDVGCEVVGLRRGDLVTSDLNFRCGRCRQCQAGRSHLCREGQVGRITNRAFASLGDLNSSYAYSVRFPVAPHLALSEPLSCVLHALRWAAPRSSDRILVLGAGGLGSAMAFALSTSVGLRAFDITDINDDRLASVDAAIGTAGRGISAGEGDYDVVFDLTGTVSGLRSACTQVSAGGRLCTMSHLDGRSCDFLLAALTRRDVSFKVSYLNGGHEQLLDAIEMLGMQWSPTWSPILEVVPWDDLQRQFEQRPQSGFPKTIVEMRTEPGPAD